MVPLLCHLLGDYVLQNHVMATRKTSSWRWAIVHASLYTLPFSLWLRVAGVDWHHAQVALAVILWTHAWIDRYRIAARWVRFYGNGCEGWLVGAILRLRGARPCKQGDTPGWWWDPSPSDPRVAGWSPALADAPPYLAVWLTILVDNTMHLVINQLALHYAGVA